jgi:hypothetical protein
MAARSAPKPLLPFITPAIYRETGMPIKRAPPFSLANRAQGGYNGPADFIGSDK